MRGMALDLISALAPYEEQAPGFAEFAVRGVGGEEPLGVWVDVQPEILTALSYTGRAFSLAQTNTAGERLSVLAPLSSITRVVERVFHAGERRVRVVTIEIEGDRRMIQGSVRGQEADGTTSLSAFLTPSNYTVQADEEDQGLAAFVDGLRSLVGGTR